MNATLREIDFAKVEAFAGQVVADMSATNGSAMTQLGHTLGLVRAMHGVGPVTPAWLAGKTGTHERYVREWLNCQAAGGYVRYDPASKTYHLPLEHGMVLADPESPAYLVAGFDVS